MGRSQMPPLSLWLKGFRNGTQRQVCTNILSPQFIHSSLRSRSGEIMCHQTRLRALLLIAREPEAEPRSRGGPPRAPKYSLVY